MNFLKRLKKAIGYFTYYYIKPDPDKFGSFGKDSLFGRPADIKKPQNIFVGDFVRIGPRSTIMTVGNSKFIIKRGCLVAEGLTVVTSNHKQVVGTFLSGHNEDNMYRDIIVEEDVWMGINVTLLSGTHVGRGAIIGAGAVIRSDIPPYSVVIGNPARIIKFKWDIDTIMRHEQALYPESERFTRNQLMNLFNSQEL